MTDTRFYGAYTLQQATDEVCRLMQEKGFASDVHSNPALVWQSLALIHTEVSEAAQCYKHGKTDQSTLGEELVDVLIRTMHLLGSLRFDVDELFTDKMNQNAARPFRYNINQSTTQ